MIKQKQMQDGKMQNGKRVGTFANFDFAICPVTSTEI